MTSPGYLFGAPLATSAPTNTVAGSVFTDAWAAAWIPLGATSEGSTFSYTTSVEPINVAEFFDPIRWETVSRQGSFAFSMASYTLHNFKRALNGGMGAITPTSGTGATALSTYSPPTPGTELRIMLGWESQDNTMRIIMHQCINGSEISSAFQKAPNIALLPVQFQFEVPSSGQPFEVFTAGTARAGA
jgi:hypothetical protein